MYQGLGSSSWMHSLSVLCTHSSPHLAADVASFIPSFSALDVEAGMRATSVYLVQRVIPMLPPLLCEELCR